jgi:GrpB-like predicted nucleotidyltransferase (UPF0157 family)
MSRPVVIMQYDHAWPRIYEEESIRIRGSVGGIIRSIEHVGSTSVPGLLAKPLIDIIVGVDGRDDAERCRVLLQPLGYNDASTGDNPDWFYCLAKTTHVPGFHLHLVREGSTHHLKHILFREWLRTHPADAEAYRELKINLAEKNRNDRVAYTNGKADFINEIVEKAKKTRA